MMSNSTAAGIDRTSSTLSRRRKKTQEVTLKDMITVDTAETTQEPNMNTDKGAQVTAMPVQIKSPETATPGTFAVESSNPLPGNRPIDSGNLQVLGTISVMGERPIVASNIKVWDTISVSGERPIASSSIQISGTAMIMGNRPIASNYIDGDQDLMGYLD